VPSPSATPAGSLALDESSNGQSFQARPGQRVTVVLPGDGRQYHGYTTPVSSDTAVLRQDTTVACDAPSGYFCTAFAVVAAGSAQLTSTSDPACRQATPPCGAPSRQWQVRVTAA
jgi:hypothetical protein